MTRGGEVPEGRIELPNVGLLSTAASDKLRFWFLLLFQGAF